MDESFANALCPPRFVVLGLTLEPLTLGHCFTLHRIGSPFVCGGDTTPADITDATYICARRWDCSERDCRRRWFPILMALWGWANRKRDLNAEATTLRRYFDVHRARPIIRQRIGQGYKALGAPDVFRMLAMLMSEFHMREREAMDYTILRANALWVSLAEYNGKLELREDADVEFARMCDEMDRNGEEVNIHALH